MMLPTFGRLPVTEQMRDMISEWVKYGKEDDRAEIQRMMQAFLPNTRNFSEWSSRIRVYSSSTSGAGVRLMRP